jgi:hypothetical protein
MTAIAAGRGCKPQRACRYCAPGNRNINKRATIFFPGKTVKDVERLSTGAADRKVKVAVFFFCVRNA